MCAPPSPLKVEKPKRTRPENTVKSEMAAAFRLPKASDQFLLFVRSESVPLETGCQ